MTTTAVLVLTSLMTLWASCDAEFTLTLMHTNDIHAHYEQFTKYGSRCSPVLASQGKCFGGIARLTTAVDKVRDQYPNSLLLDGGDQYQGTLYFYRHGGNITSNFMNWLFYDAMALGNHEFDRGIEGVVPFLEHVGFEVLSSNTDAAEEPSIQGLFKKSAVFNVGGHKVGVVGYITTDTPQISHPGKLKFFDVVTSVTKEVNKLTSQGVKIIIALGHAGFTVDKEVAKIPGVDVVIGGHTNTFLYTGQVPSNEVPVGPYPVVVSKGDSSKSVVAQCYTWAKYLCVLHVTFNDQGKLLSWRGNPELLDNSVPQDADTLKELEPYKEAVQDLTTEVVGETLVKLEGDFTVCRNEECNLGNLITDSMVAQNRDHPDKAETKDINIAVINGGMIRSSIGLGDFTIGDILNVLPFGNTIDAFQMEGRYLKKMFEYCASRLDPCIPELNYGGFLQVSGLRVTYDFRKPKDSRVASLEAKVTGSDGEARFEPVEDGKMYKMLVPDYLGRGGDGYDVIKQHARRVYNVGDVASDMLVEYVKKNTPIAPVVEGRIQFLHHSNVCNNRRNLDVKSTILTAIRRILTNTAHL